MVAPLKRLRISPGGVPRFAAGAASPSRTRPLRIRVRRSNYLRVVVPSLSVRRFELVAVLPEGPVEATARTLSRPVRSARRLAPLGSFTLIVREAPGATL